MKISKIFLPLLTAIFCTISSSSFALGAVLYEQKQFENGDLVSQSQKEAAKNNAENTKNTVQKDVQDKIATEKSTYQGEPLTADQQEIIANDKEKLTNKAQTTAQQKAQKAKNQVNYLREHPIIP